jgi:HEAT repeat protein
MSRTAAWKLLLAGLVHADPLVRCDAARLLGELGDRRAVPALARLLTRDRHLTKITAVYALGELGDRRAAPVLRRIAADPGVFRFPGMHYHDMIRLAAALALARRDDARGVAAVGDLLRLQRLPAMIELGPAILAAPRTAAMRRLRAYVSLPFVQLFHGPLPRASSHFFAVRCLAHLRVPEARRQLVVDLAHYSRYVRAAAAAALLAHGPEGLTAVARQAKRERTAFGRLRFAALLHAHGRGDATAAVARGLRNRDAFIRATALDAAAELRLRAIAGAALALLADPDWHVRSRAAAALPVLAPREADAALAPLLADAEPRVAIAAAAALLAA